MSEKSTVLIDGWIQLSGWISALLVSGITLCGIVIASRVFDKRKLTIKEIEFPLKYFWVVVLAFTNAHAFLTWSFVNTCSRVKALNEEDRNIAWERLTTGNNLVFNGMTPRPRYGELIVCGLKIPVYDLKFEPSALLALVFAGACFFATAVRVRKGIIGWADYFMIGFTFCSANWMLGSVWASAASQIVK